MLVLVDRAVCYFPIYSLAMQLCSQPLRSFAVYYGAAKETKKKLLAPHQDLETDRELPSAVHRRAAERPGVVQHLERVRRQWGRQDGQGRAFVSHGRPLRGTSTSRSTRSYGFRGHSLSCIA